MSFAKYASTCPRCLKPINVGDTIKWARRGPERGRKVHQYCAYINPTTKEPQMATGDFPRKIEYTDYFKVPEFVDHDFKIEYQYYPDARFKNITPEQHKKISDFLTNLKDFNARINAIKYVREITGCGLKDAKDYIDSYKRPEMHPDFQPKPKEQPMPQPQQQQLKSDDLAKALEILGKYISNPISEADVKKMVVEEFAKLPKSEPIKIDVQRSDGEVKRIDNAHAKMPQLLYLLSKKHHVYLYGAPGSGKSTAAKMASDALGINFGYISLNPQTPDSRLMGYMDATGNYRETLFHKLYRDGGVFCIDEMDNASASLLTTLNSCLENGHGAFPNGMIPRHKDFIVVATGNTAGRGANAQFPDRRPFDSAFAERFTFIEWDYDLNLEEAITLSYNPKAGRWLNWVRRVRQFAKQNHPKLIVSPRASFRGAEYLIDSKWAVTDIAEAVLFKGIDKDTVNAILKACPIDIG